MTNDTLLPENGVTNNNIDANDTRERLEADVYRAADDMDMFYNGERFLDTRKIIGWLDRQAAITERECRDYENELRKQHHKRVYDLKAKVDELTEERDQLLEQTEKYAEEAANFEQALADVERTHMRLPVDADGVPIRVGEKIQPDHGARSWVMAVSDTDWVDHGGFSHSAATSLHVQPDTVESLLDGFVKESIDILSTNHDVDWDELGKLVLEVNSDKRDEYAERIRRACNG